MFGLRVDLAADYSIGTVKSSPQLQDGAPSYKLVYKPHEYYSYIYHKP